MVGASSRDRGDVTMRPPEEKSLSYFVNMGDIERISTAI